MKKMLYNFKILFLENILKLLGVCSVLILFEACCGTPKSAWRPSNEPNNHRAVQMKTAQKPNKEKGIEKPNEMNRGKKINPA